MVSRYILDTFRKVVSEVRYKILKKYLRYFQDTFEILLMREKKPILCKSKVQYDDLFLLLQKNIIDMHFSHFLRYFLCKNLPLLRCPSNEILNKYLKSISNVSEILSEKQYLDTISDTF